MANIFAVVLAENRQVFQPGETISGALLLNTDKEMNLRGVRVELHGLGHVRIRSGRVTYDKKETYLSFQAILLGRGKNDSLLLKYGAMYTHLISFIIFIFTILISQCMICIWRPGETKISYREFELTATLILVRLRYIINQERNSKSLIDLVNRIAY